MKIEKLDKFHKTKAGYLVFGLIELALAYLTVSWAIDSGSLLAYFLSIILLIGGVHNLIRIIARKTE